MSLAIDDDIYTSEGKTINQERVMGTITKVTNAEAFAHPDQHWERPNPDFVSKMREQQGGFYHHER